MEGAQAASRGDRAGAELPMEPLENQVPGLAQPQAPAEERRLESPESSPAAAVQEATGAGPDLSGGKKLPSPRPARLRVLPASLGYGAFRRQLSAAPEPPSPGPAAAEQPRDGEAAGTELVPRAAPEEPVPGSWAPMELQVDVLVKPVGAAGGSRAPSPAPSRRFITVPVPESPAFPRHAAPAFPLLPRTASLGSTWSRGSPLAAARAAHGLDAEGQTGPTEGGAESPGSPTCRCRCRCQELGREDAALLQRAEVDGDLKLHRAIKLIGLPMYMKSLRWALVVMAVLLAVSTVAIVALASRTGSGCRPCPHGWLWSGEHCYYLSTEAQAWEASQAFCSAHSATLPLLIHTQDFLGRYPVTKYSWVGARRGPQGWHWTDGGPPATPATPGGRQGPAGSEVRWPGGRQARGFGLRLFKTLGLCPGDQVTGVLPIPTLLGAYSCPQGGLFPGPRLLPERSGELGLCCRKITPGKAFCGPSSIFASSC